MQLARRSVLHHIAVTAFLLLVSIHCSSAQFCPPGSTQVPGGGGFMCQCPDGSFASYKGCRQHVRPQSQIPAGSTQCGTGYCPPGTKCGSGGKCLARDAADCGHGRACNPGYKCSTGGGCVPEHAVDCGQGKYCAPGMVCSGTSQCITQEEATRQQAVAKAKQTLDKFGIKDGLLVKDAELRHKRAIQYALDNPEVQSALRDLIASHASTAIYGPAGDKAASALLNIKAALEEMKEFKNGQYYQGSLHITNQVSSIMLQVLPYGGASADVLNLAGAVTTAYVYGFFWGN